LIHENTFTERINGILKEELELSVETNFWILAIFIISINQKHVVNKKPRFVRNGVFKKKGDDILSHITAVPSAQAGLTTLFGMGRGEPRRNNHLKVVLQWVIGLCQSTLHNILTH
jgi:hypothetical protein